MSGLRRDAARALRQLEKRTEGVPIGEGADSSQAQRTTQTPNRFQSGFRKTPSRSRNRQARAEGSFFRAIGRGAADLT
jgi:hypothetical protein